ncbi:hypothetical protein NLM33_34845 [Bradyrhizobium sp. CCGUVB1N3]|uniref:hypothetical protein n=1 Tax=Bradyrhizobium sp. CCGUVB1N3 TaxID=2949629 RepID=UPI0020B2D953|nr:hypothetical protein [Bradyrhizobium sp. CCGUVB1N3]MCP3475482.1 hypothetical protein [Bradyrhizobium sp. CCGUVB1N3]
MRILAIWTDGTEFQVETRAARSSFKPIQIRLRRNMRPCRDEGVGNLEVAPAGGNAPRSQHRDVALLERHHAALLHRDDRGKNHEPGSGLFLSIGVDTVPAIKERATI